MKPALAQICSLNSPFQADVEEYAAGKLQAIELWLGKLEQYLETHTVDDVRRLLDSHEVVAPVASYQGGLLLSQGDARREHWNHFERRLNICRQLSVRTIVIAGDLVGSLTQQDLDRATLSLRQAAQLAAEHQVRVAFEFQAHALFANNLQTASAWVEQISEPNLGLCFDLFHFYCGPSKHEDLAFLSGDNLFHVQLSDLVGTPRELATDSDRVLPGDGDFLLEPLLDRLRAINYDGFVSIETMNPQIWQIPPRQFGEVGLTVLRKLLGQASMD